MAGSSIDAADDGVLRVSGALVFANAAELLRRAGPLLTRSGPLTIDLAAVGDCDSAGLALLLEWIDLGRQRGVAIRYRNIPDALLGIARLSNVVELIAPSD